MSINTVTIIGRCVANPELRYTPSGKAVCDLRLVINEKRGGKESSIWINATCWDRVAEIAAEYISKGSEVGISGRLKQDEWEKDGVKHSKIGVTVSDLQLIGSRKKEADAPQDDPPEQPTGDGDIPF